MIAYKNQFFEKYQKNVYSQNGEDGVIQELLSRAGVSLPDTWVCEFGAWDGKNLSNTFDLVVKGANAVYIESERERFNALLETVKQYPRIVPVEARVSQDEESDLSLDSILSSTPIDNQNFSVLSIDIDSYDYQIWKTLKKYTPLFVVIEINSGIAPTDMTHIHDERHQGTGFGPMLELGKQKGYTFVCHTGNMIFARNDIFAKLCVDYTHPIENFRRKWLPS